MINKKNLWFLTLFSLVLVLSIYYVTMPNELLLTSNGVEDGNNDKQLNVKESGIISALKVEDNNSTLKEIGALKEILTKEDSSVDDKNKAFDALKLINQISSKEELLEEKIMNNYSLDSFVKIDGDQIRVVIESETHDNDLANKIMKTIQKEFDTKQYISIQFK
ncbi:stage III sporulation protein AH [Clostridium sp. CAG:914]|jgi:stage III sporulation protein AH|nr:SpoIIIAH-like family protein [Clostridium sp.]CDE95794.1 stage III sporulation protein AH [Clostridium sp. CAG:914]